MTGGAATVMVQRVQMTHGLILKISEDLTDEHLAWRLKESGPPPIGWHLWHISRWADRLQASFAADPPGGGDDSEQLRDFWTIDGLAAKWGLDPAVLGLLETGVLMDREAASLLPPVGRENLFGYTRRVFAAAGQALLALDADQFDQRRPSILAIKMVGNSIVAARGADTTVGGDVAFHLAHANRHLGMMEVLSGMQGLRGSATI